MEQNEEGAVPNEDELNAQLAGNAGEEDVEQGVDGGEEDAEQDAGAQDEQDDGAHAQHEEKPVSRATARVQRALEAKATAEAEAKLLREQAEFYRRQAEQLAQQRQAPAAEPEYVDPDEKWRRESQAMLQRGLAQTQDLADKANFALAAVKNPLQAKYVDKVEAEIQRLRAQGNYGATREGVFMYLLGQDTAANYGKKTPAAAAAEKRVAAAKRQPAPSGSNVQAPRGDRSLEERLSGQIL